MSNSRNLANLGDTISEASSVGITFEGSTLVIDSANNIVKFGSNGIQFADGTKISTNTTYATTTDLSNAYTQANTATTNAANAYTQANTATTNAANASNLSAGTVPPARLGSGTANSNTYLAGDGKIGRAHV